jgi:hypothetical protein
MRNKNRNEIMLLLNIGKTQSKNTSHLLYDRLPECHSLTPPVTLGSSRPDWSTK